MPAGDPKTVLVVDDDADLTSLVTLVLEGEGYRVEAANGGPQALEMVGRQMPDLILLDMKMPGMDGVEFAREFHARHDDGAPILILTGSVDARGAAREAEAAGWLSKPFDLDALVRIVQQHVA